MNPELVLMAIAVGVLGVLFELCYPRWVAPGVGGLTLVVLGVAALARTQIPWREVIWGAIPLAVVSVFLVRTAMRARANKLTAKLTEGRPR